MRSTVLQILWWHVGRSVYVSLSVFANLCTQFMKIFEQMTRLLFSFKNWNTSTLRYYFSQALSGHIKVVDFKVSKHVIL